MGQEQPSAKELLLIQASEKGENKKLIEFLNDGVNPNCSNFDGMTPLHYAVQNGNLSSVKILILNGANINKKDVDKRTPLLLSVHFNQIDIAEFLVQKDADVNIPDYAGLTPLFYAAAYGDFLMTDMFLFYKGNHTVKDLSGKTPFMASIWGGFPSVAKKLLDYGADINYQDKDGNTSLMLAILNQDSISLDSLISWNASLETENASHHTALEVALQANDRIAINKLISAGSDVNHNIQTDFNTMDYAISYGINKKIKDILSKAGATHHKALLLKNISLGITSMIGREDSKLGVKAQWFDSRYHFGFGFGLAQRPGRLKVFYPVSESVSYLFRETRTSITINSFKLLPLLRFRKGKHAGLVLSAELDASIGEYKASSKKAGFELYGVPSISLFYANSFIRYEVGYQYILGRNYLWSHSGIIFNIYLPLKKHGK